jgi:hypothetical protein
VTDQDKLIKAEMDSAEVRIQESLRVSSLPPYRNGPACYLMIDRTTEVPNCTDCFLVGPVSNYNEVVVSVSWKMADPAHTASFDLWQTTDPDYILADHLAADHGDMLPLLDQYDQEKSEFLYWPRTFSAENHVVLRYPKLVATHIGMRLATIPKKARLDARIWVMMIRDGVEGR